MDRKRPKKSRTIFKKRRNVGLPKKSSSDLPEGCSPSTSKSSPRPSPGSSKAQDSASKTKLGDIDEHYKKYLELDSNSENIIIDLSLLNMTVSQTVACSKCFSVSVEVRRITSFGLASQLEFFCNSCKYSYPFISSNKVKGRSLYEINARLVYGMRAIGKGREGAKTMCGVMNLPPPPTDFLLHTEMLGSAAEDVCFQTMRDSVEEAVLVNEGVRDIPVAIDGTWQKRGHTSLNGVVTATSFDTGKVIDLSVMSKHCSCPKKLDFEHLPKCQANFKGASGGMEVQGALEIFRNSLPAYNVKYSRYLGDGDSKGFQAVQELNPYGDDVPITKLECIGHIQKRMGTRLRRLKSQNKGLKLSDGKTLGGKNRLSSAVIDQLQTYYGLAIRRSDTVSEMRKAIWALFYHKSSTDENPQHGLCPKGEQSWCKFQRAEVNHDTYHHKNSLPVPVMEFIRPVFQSLSDTELLQKCLHKKTQNPNESVNSVIWARLPKTGFVGIKTLYFGAYEAVSTFNVGQITKCRVLEKLGINVGKNTAAAMKALDLQRLRNSLRATAELKKKARQTKRQAKRKLEDEEEDPDNPSYGPGMF